MRLSCTYLAAAGFWLAFPGISLAQPIENGMEVQVYPAPAGGRTLLYPGGEYGRSVPRLLYPGQRNGPISLHMPVAHAAHRAVARSETATAPKREAKARAPKRVAKAPAPKRVASLPKPKAAPQPARAPAQPAQTMPNIFNGPDYSNIFGNQPAKPPSPPSPPPVQRQASAAPPPVHTAPAGPTTGNESLTKRSMILFAKDAADPAAGALGSIKFLAGELNAAMTSPNARVELQAFGGAKGDKGSDARRLSLKRALAIRQVLIDDGVSPDRIDVRAMGGVDDSGPTDRVDVYTKA